jgi:hypothetical protein
MEPGGHRQAEAPGDPQEPNFADRGKKKPSSRERDIRRDETFVRLYETCAPNSMTTLERLFGVYSSIEYIVRNDIPGDIVECGVWRGGSMMMAAMSLLHFHDRRERRLFLFDTFEGMPPPGVEDLRYDGTPAGEKWQELRRGDGSSWNYAPLDAVRDVMRSSGYPEERTVLVKGRVEDTLPRHAPKDVALLRLDTDFYSSTKHELRHLFPLLVPGGVLIIDDFGTWEGSRRAVEEYFTENKIVMLLNRLDAAGRIGVKLPKA